MALLVAVEGIDGSGKGTQTALLAENLRRRGLQTEVISFPRYDATRYGQKIGEFLNGRFGTLDQVHPALAALLFAGDRFESRSVLLDLCERADVVLCDRYVASNIAHQGAKVDVHERTELIDWIEFVEYQQHQMPRPDLVIWLQLPVSVAQSFITQKARRSYTEHTADLQEADGGYLQRTSDVYEALARAGGCWQTVQAHCNGQPRSIDDVSRELERIVWELYQARRKR